MSYLLAIVGRGLLAELRAAFRGLLHDEPTLPTAELRNRVARYPSSAEWLRRLGLRFLHQGRLAEARRVFENAVQIDASDPVARVGLACVLDEQGLTRGALKLLTENHENDPQDAATTFALGFCLEKLGEPQSALNWYQAAVSRSPTLRNAYERMAAIHLRFDRANEAIELYEQLAAADPADFDSTLALAHLYVRSSQYENAARCFEQVVTLDPSRYDAQDELVAAYVETGQLEQAIQTLRQLISQRAPCGELQLQLGDLLQKSGDHEGALAAYLEAVTLNPDHLEAEIKMGTCRLRRGELERAAESFGRAVELNDRMAGAYVGLGVVHGATGRHEEALNSFELARTIEPNSTLLFSEVARIQLKVQAAEQCRRYLSPRGLAAAAAPAGSEKVTSLVQRQIQLMKAELARRPDHADLWYHLGLLLCQQGELESAIQAFRSAVRINPQYSRARFKLSLALWEHSDRKEAIAVAEQGLKVDRESLELHYQLGLLFADRKRFTEALEHFRAAEIKNPRNNNYLAHVALALQNMGLLDRAQETWRLLLDLSDSATYEPRKDHKLTGPP